MKLLIICGMPASGKSTVAAKIAAAMGLPVIEKDELKESLFDTVGFNCYAEKRKLDTAASAVLLRTSESLLRSGVSHVIVNNFRSDFELPVRELINKYSPAVLTVFFDGDPDVFYRRYVERDLRGERHVGHVVQNHYPPSPTDPTTYTMTREEFREKFESLGMSSFSTGSPTIKVDATCPETINVNELIAEIDKYFKTTEK